MPARSSSWRALRLAPSSLAASSAAAPCGARRDWLVRFGGAWACRLAAPSAGASPEPVARRFAGGFGRGFAAARAGASLPPVPEPSLEPLSRATAVALARRGGGRGLAGDDRLDFAGEGAPGGLAAQRRGGHRADHAVGLQPAAGLEVAHRGFRFGAEDAVHFDPAEGLLEQPHLPAFAAGVEHDRVFGGRGRLGVGTAAGERGLAARDPGGGGDGEGRQCPQRDALGARAGGDEVQLRRPAASAGASERQLPGRSFGQVSGASPGGRCERSARSSSRACGCGGRILGWPGRVVPASVAGSRSRGQRRQDHEWIPTFAAVLSSTFLGAYGVSCRARVNVYATPHMWRFAPAVEPHWVPRSAAPWGQGFGTNGGQPNRFVRKMRCSCRNRRLGLDGCRRRGPPKRC